MVVQKLCGGQGCAFQKKERKKKKHKHRGLRGPRTHLQGNHAPLSRKPEVKTPLEKLGSAHVRSGGGGGQTGHQGRGAGQTTSLFVLGSCLCKLPRRHHDAHHNAGSASATPTHHHHHVVGLCASSNLNLALVRCVRAKQRVGRCAMAKPESTKIKPPVPLNTCLGSAASARSLACQVGAPGRHPARPASK